MALQNCSNTISLRCCSNNAIIITPCVPTIDGTPFSNYTLGNVYFDSNNVCWEAVDSTSNAYNTLTTILLQQIVLTVNRHTEETVMKPQIHHRVSVLVYL